MNRKNFVRALLAFVLSASASASAEDGPSKEELLEELTKAIIVVRYEFQLLNDCRDVSLHVVNLSEDATKIGLKKGEIEVAVRSRLRGARLFQDASTQPDWVTRGFHVNAHVVGQAFHTRVEFKKFVLDEASGANAPAVTWSMGYTGTHGNDPGYILGTISQLTDHFIDEYMRVNAAACEK